MLAQISTFQGTKFLMSSMPLPNMSILIWQTMNLKDSHHILAEFGLLFYLMKLGCHQISWNLVCVGWEFYTDCTFKIHPSSSRNTLMSWKGIQTELCNCLERIEKSFQTLSLKMTIWETTKASQQSILNFFIFIFILHVASHNAIVVLWDKLHFPPSFYCKLCLQEAYMPLWRFGLCQEIGT